MTEPRQLEFEAIGAPWLIQVRDPITNDTWATLATEIQDIIEKFNQTFSRFRTDSWVAKLRDEPKTTSMPEGGYELIRFYDRLYHATDGKLTPLIGDVMVEAGYDANYSFKPGTLHSPPSWDEAIEYTKTTFTLKLQVMLDFGAAGKGRLVDLISEAIEAAGVTNYTVDGSGDMRHRGTERIRVGMEHPLDAQLAVGVIELDNTSLCASSGAKRQWEGYTHIIDPVALESPREIIGTWVVADDAMTADGLATALFFVNSVNIMEVFKADYAILRKDMQLECSANFPAELFKD